MSGSFALFRKSSSYENTVIRSNLNISFDATRNVVHGTHDFKDMAEGDRTSTGIFIPVNRNIYGILSVEGGQALEILALAHPLPKKATLIHGAVITIGLTCSPISAKIVLDGSNDMWDGRPTRMDLAQIDPDLKDRLKSILPFLDQQTSNMIQT
jgi:hypothetical protein